MVTGNPYNLSSNSTILIDLSFPQCDSARTVGDFCQGWLCVLLVGSHFLFRRLFSFGLFSEIRRCGVEVTGFHWVAFIRQCRPRNAADEESCITILILHRVTSPTRNIHAYMKSTSPNLGFFSVPSKLGRFGILIKCVLSDCNAFSSSILKCHLLMQQCMQDASHIPGALHIRTFVVALDFYHFGSDE